MTQRAKFIDEYLVIMLRELNAGLPQTDNEVELINSAATIVSSKAMHLKSSLTQNWQGDRS